MNTYWQTLLITITLCLFSHNSLARVQFDDFIERASSPADFKPINKKDVLGKLPSKKLKDGAKPILDKVIKYSKRHNMDPKLG